MKGLGFKYWLYGICFWDFLKVFWLVLISVCGYYFYFIFG